MTTKLEIQNWNMAKNNFKTKKTSLSKNVIFKVWKTIWRMTQKIDFQIWKTSKKLENLFFKFGKRPHFLFFANVQKQSIFQI